MCGAALLDPDGRSRRSLQFSVPSASICCSSSPHSQGQENTDVIRDHMTEPVALSWSGGKDSSLALQQLRASGTHDVVALLTSVTREYDRVSIHGVRRALLEAQANALGLPLIEVWLEPKSSDAAYQRAFLDALQVLSDRHPAVRLIAFGDLYLRDIRDYRDRLLAGTPYRGLYPL